MRGWHVHNVEHHLSPVLAGSRTFLDVLSACLTGDADSIYAAINPARRRSAIRNELVVKRAASRHSLLAPRALRHLAARRTLHAIDGRDFQMVSVHTLLRRHARDLAEEAMILLSPHLSPDRLVAMRRMPEHETDARPYLKTAHGTAIFYSIFCARLFHDAPSSTRAKVAWIRRVGIQDTATGQILTVIDGSRVQACEVQADGTVPLATLDARDDAACLYVRPCEVRAVHVVSGALFMCAEADSRIMINRHAAAAWEMFRPA